MPGDKADLGPVPVDRGVGQSIAQPAGGAIDLDGGVAKHKREIAILTRDALDGVKLPIQPLAGRDLAQELRLVLDHAIGMDIVEFIREQRLQRLDVIAGHGGKTLVLKGEDFSFAGVGVHRMSPFGFVSLGAHADSWPPRMALEPLG